MDNNKKLTVIDSIEIYMLPINLKIELSFINAILDYKKSLDNALGTYENFITKEWKRYYYHQDPNIQQDKPYFDSSLLIENNNKKIYI